MAGPHVVDPSERVAAHDWATSFRDRRVELRSKLGSGTLTLAQALDGAERSDDGAIKLLFLLESLPGASKVATRRRLAELGLLETVPLRDLTADERATVLREFPLPAPGAGAEAP